MKIYYTDVYRENKGESHELLEKAVALELDSEYGSREAALLVETIHSSTEYGKPVIDNFKDFSISHTGSLWAVAVADCQCGLDIQNHKEGTAIDRVAGRYYTEAEQAAIHSDGDWRFFWLWARREALVKAVGTTVVNSNLPDVLDDHVAFEGQQWYLKSFKLPEHDDCYCAVCTGEAAECDRELEFIRIR